MVTGKEDHTGVAIEVPISIVCIFIEGEARVPTAGGVGGGLDIQRL